MTELKKKKGILNTKKSAKKHEKSVNVVKLLNILTISLALPCEWIKKGERVKKRLKKRKRLLPIWESTVPNFSRTRIFTAKLQTPEKMGLLVDMLSDRTLAVSVCSIIIQIYTLLTAFSE